MSEAIEARVRARRVHELEVTEWQTRVVCQFLGMQAMVDIDQHGGRNPIMDEAAKISIFRNAGDRGASAPATTGTPADGTGQQLTDEERRLMAEAYGERVPDRPQAQADSGLVDESTIAAGTFERFMSRMGHSRPSGGGMKPLPGH